jgi:molybdopterin biosynthesis enzyme
MPVIDRDACPVLALSEDPIAAVAPFFTFVRSIVDILLSAVEQPSASITLPTGFTHEENHGERPLLLARLTIERGGASTSVPRAK